MRFHPRRIVFGIISSIILASLYYVTNRSTNKRKSFILQDTFEAFQSRQKQQIKINKTPLTYVNKLVELGKQVNLKKQRNMKLEKKIIPIEILPRLATTTTTTTATTTTPTTATTTTPTTTTSTTTTSTTTTTTKKAKQKEIFNNATYMYELHNKIYNEFTDQEILDYYNRERESERLFKNVLDINKDRALISTLFPNPNETRDRITDQLRLKLNVTERKTILMLNADSSNNEQKLRADKCNIQECNVIRDNKKLNEADVVFTKNSVNQIKRSNEAKPNQTWVWFQIESAQNYPRATSGLKANWSATYRRDSVLNTPYERFTPYLNVITLPSKPLRNYAKGKRKLVAWFVSNCGGQNRRMKYVTELEKYIPVDIYGGCGPLKCNRRNKQCFKMLKNDYKFYLSFENTNCKDYVTEKLFWNAYLNDVIPIVMGAHPNDYKAIAPPKSYIHVDRFKSPSELAQYLRFLDKHDDLYNSYFHWKGTGEFINTKFMCRLCAMAHIAPYFPMWYDDANKWWKGKSTCNAARTYSYATWKEHPTNQANEYKEVMYGYKRESTS